jgi:hypothetical protein
MNKMSRRLAFSFLLAGAIVALGANLSQAQNPPPDYPAVTVKGHTYTPRSILARNMGTEEDQTKQFLSIGPSAV